MKQLPLQHYIDVEPSRPKLARSDEQREIIRKRNEMRRAVGIFKLRQQGLGWYEAEAQYDSRIGRRP